MNSKKLGTKADQNSSKGSVRSRRSSGKSNLIVIALAGVLMLGGCTAQGDESEILPAKSDDSSVSESSSSTDLSDEPAASESFDSEPAES